MHDFDTKPAEGILEASDARSGLVLGLDVSTSVVGFVLLRLDGGIDTMTSIRLERVRGFWDKVDAAHLELHRLLSGKDVVASWIEEPAMMYTPGRSSIQTIGTLLKFNALVSWKVRELFGDPSYIAASAARKACGVKTQWVSKVGKPHKLQAFEQVTAPGGPLAGLQPELNRAGNVQPHVYDEVDAFIIARAGLLMHMAT